MGLPPFLQFDAPNRNSIYTLIFLHKTLHKSQRSSVHRVADGLGGFGFKPQPRSSRIGVNPNCLTVTNGPAQNLFRQRRFHFALNGAL
jgi:hypothetical protein